jgi:hypothetical protein
MLSSLYDPIQNLAVGSHAQVFLQRNPVVALSCLLFVLKIEAVDPMRTW